MIEAIPPVSPIIIRFPLFPKLLAALAGAIVIAPDSVVLKLEDVLKLIVAVPAEGVIVS